MKYYSWPIGLFCVFLVSQAALADQTTGMDMDHMTTSSSPLSKSSQEYMAAMGDMHKKMADGVKNSDPDIAFAQGMIPHHQGAIAMAETELRYGKDPQMRKMAENVIKAQKAEIATMNDWLNQHSSGRH